MITQEFLVLFPVGLAFVWLFCLAFRAVFLHPFVWTVGESLVICLLLVAPVFFMSKSVIARTVTFFASLTSTIGINLITVYEFQINPAYCCYNVDIYGFDKGLCTDKESDIYKETKGKCKSALMSQTTEYVFLGIVGGCVLVVFIATFFSVREHLIQEKNKD